MKSVLKVPDGPVSQNQAQFAKNREKHNINRKQLIIGNMVADLPADASIRL